MILPFYSTAQKPRFDKSECATGDLERDMELSASYINMSSNHYFGLTHATAFELEMYEAVYYKQLFSVHYAPNSQSLKFEANPSLFLLIYSMGCGIGYDQSYLHETGAFYFRPEVELDLFYAKVSYSYTFPGKGNFHLVRSHNIGVTIPLVSTCGFKRFKDRKTYHLGHAYNYLGNIAIYN